MTRATKALLPAALLGVGLWAFPLQAMEEFNAIVTIDELCALMACRPAGRIAMRRGDAAGTIVIETKKSPYVFQGTLTVFSGEANRYELDIRAGTLHDIRLSRHASADWHLALKLSQTESRADAGSVFSIANPLPVPLTLRLDPVRPGATKPEPTIICEVAAASSLPLDFGYPVFQLVVDLELAKEAGSPGQCRTVDA